MNHTVFYFGYGVLHTVMNYMRYLMGLFKAHVVVQGDLNVYIQFRAKQTGFDQIQRQNIRVPQNRVLYAFH